VTAMDWLSIFNAVLFAQTIQAVTPILLAGLAGVLCDRAGVFTSRWKARC